MYLFVDGRPITATRGGHFDVLENMNLHIREVSKSDQGTYTCEASNALGEASSSGRLVTLCKYRFIVRSHMNWGPVCV